MAQHDSPDFLIDDAEFEPFDPLADFGTEEDIDDTPIESGLFNPQDAGFPDAKTLAEDTEKARLQPPEKRTADLMNAMKNQRSVLLGILDFVQQHRTDEDTVAFIKELQKDNYSVYSPDNICMLLRQAGAIERVTADGESFEGVVLEPNRVVVDGVQFWEPAPLPELFWSITHVGRSALDGFQPRTLIRQLIESEPEYASVYRAVLERIDCDEGADQKALSGMYDNKPVIEKPRLYVERFVDRLSEAGAIKWQSKAWRLTEPGREAFAALDELEHPTRNE